LFIAIILKMYIIEPCGQTVLLYKVASMSALSNSTMVLGIRAVLVPAAENATFKHYPRNILHKKAPYVK